MLLYNLHSFCLVLKSSQGTHISFSRNRQEKEVSVLIEWEQRNFRCSVFNLLSG